MLQDLSQIYLLEGFKNFEKRKINSSIIHLKKALLFNNDNWEAMNLMGLCLYLQGFFTEARNWWNKSMLLNSLEENLAQNYLNSMEKDDFKRFCSLYNEALKFAQDGNFKQANSILDNEIFNTCHIVPVYNMKGLCMAAAGKQSAAVNLWKQSLAINIEDTTAINYIADSLEIKKERTALQNLFHRIFRKD